MSDELPDADDIADLLLPLDGPYPPERVIEAARTIHELTRRLNHATRHRALAFPPQLYYTIAALASAVHRMEQTFTQLAARLHTFATDPRVQHDQRHDPSTACVDAAAALRRAAANLNTDAAHLDTAAQLTGHLGYDTTTRRHHASPVMKRPGTQPPTAAPPPPGAPRRSSSR